MEGKETVKVNEEDIKKFCTAMKIDKENDIFIYDPYVISTVDLETVGIKNLVRVRRPFWGKGGIDNFVKLIGFNKFKKELKNDEKTT